MPSAWAEIVWSAQPRQSFIASFPTGAASVSVPAKTAHPIAWEKTDAWFIEVQIDGKTRIVRTAKQIDKSPSGIVQGKTFVAARDLQLDANLQYAVLAKGESYPVLKREDEKLSLAMPDVSPVATCVFPEKYFELVMGSIKNPGESSDDLLRGSQIDLMEEIDALRQAHACADIPLAQKPEDYVCLIESPEGAGSGFLLREGDNVYCYTAFHVIDGMREPIIRLLSGETFEPLTLEVSNRRDIARMLVSGCPPALTGFRQPVIGEKLTVCGNSQGRGRVTLLKGAVTGIGDNEVETDAGFTLGNSGSALVAEKDKYVIGVASYIEELSDSNDFAVRGTKFSTPRRVSACLDDQIEWIPAELDHLASANRRYHDHSHFLNESFVLLERIYSNPTKQVSTTGLSNISLVRWAKFHNENVVKMLERARIGIASEADLSQFVQTSLVKMTEQHAQFRRMCQMRGSQIRALRNYPGTEFQKQLNMRLLKECEDLNYVNDLILNSLQQQISH
ncbi:hypothetical protein GCM10007047_11440 [Cerasicoccus arenae]|uniref:Serine protease n=1 Tax=Cerasicoccus arenae TaxID=424488 RepID=A0A8J3D918_9BACT|nr:hypothetical protein GCM10007047_11440 [Cerasicoccus arenae]